MSALLLLFTGALIGWAFLREHAQRQRWRQAERLSRALFAAAGLRGRR